MNFFGKMIENTVKAIPPMLAIFALVLAVLTLSVANNIAMYQNQNATPVYGGTASNPSVAAVFETSLAAPMGATDSAFTLASVQVDSAGDTLTNGVTYPFTVDQGTNVQEFITATCISTACTVVQRGLSPLTGTTSVSALKFSHRRGADVKITDWPTIGILNNQLNGIESIPNPIFYDNVSTTTLANGNVKNLATVELVNYVGTSGCGNASSVARGCVQFATAAQAASSTSTGSSGALLAIPASIATSSNDVAGLHAVITQNNGTINANQIDKTVAYNWSALHTFSAGFIVTASSTFATATTSITGLLAIATTTPPATGYNFALGGNGYISGGLSIGASSSTPAGGLLVTGTATTSSLFIAKSCSGCFRGIATVTNTGAGPTGNSASASVSATCSGSQIVVGGGESNTVSANLSVVASNPSGGNSWAVTYVAGSSGASANTMTVYAICVNP